MTERVQLVCFKVSFYDFKDFGNLLVDKLVTVQTPISIVTNCNIKNVRMPDIVKNNIIEHILSLICTQLY